MANIITTDTAIRFKGSSVSKTSLQKVVDLNYGEAGVRVSGPSISIDIFLTDTINGQSFSTVKELRDYVDENFFKGGTSPGPEVVTWDDVQDKPLKELDTPLADSEGLVPVYTQNGQLPVGTPEFPENAVPLILLDSRLSFAQRTAINALVSPETDYADMTEATAAIKAIIDALKAT